MENIREIRRAIGLSQHELADMLGLSRSLLSLVETGHRRMPTSALLRLTEMRISTEKNHALVSEEENVAAEDDVHFIREEIQLRLDRAISLRENIQRELDDMTRRYLGAELGAAMLQKEMALYEGVPRVTQKLQGRLSRQLRIRENAAPGKQLLLQLRIDELSALIALYQSKISEV
ncbi:MAG: helix-turn-helix domain-containing protein [Flavobacteriales bacterium]